MADGRATSNRVAVDVSIEAFDYLQDLSIEKFDGDLDAALNYLIQKAEDS